MFGDIAKHTSRTTHISVHAVVVGAVPFVRVVGTVLGTIALVRDGNTSFIPHTGKLNGVAGSRNGSGAAVCYSAEIRGARRGANGHIFEKLIGGTTHVPVETVVEGATPFITVIVAVLLAVTLIRGGDARRVTTASELNGDATRRRGDHRRMSRHAIGEHMQGFDTHIRHVEIEARTPRVVR